MSDEAECSRSRSRRAFFFTGLSLLAWLFVRSIGITALLVGAGLALIAVGFSIAALKASRRSTEARPRAPYVALPLSLLLVLANLYMAVIVAGLSAMH